MSPVMQFATHFEPFYFDLLYIISNGCVAQAWPVSTCRSLHLQLCHLCMCKSSFVAQSFSSHRGAPRSRDLKCASKTFHDVFLAQPMVPCDILQHWKRNTHTHTSYTFIYFFALPQHLRFAKNLSSWSSLWHDS